MIIKKEPLSMAEVLDYVKKSKEENTETTGFLKKFVKLNIKESKELRKKLEALELIKVKTEHIVKIIDLLPENAEDLNKIFITTIKCYLLFLKES